MYKIDNAVIMAAGTSSRFAPLSYEYPKSLIRVRGEILLERQIRQLHEAGITDIYLVVGYKKEKFEYLTDKFGVKLVYNPDYLTRNNNSSIYAVKDHLSNTYICSSDNYFRKNPFELFVEDSFYSAVYAHGDTNEWCVSYDASGYIKEVTIGGRNMWYMLGHTFWSKEFSLEFINILEQVYNLPETSDKLWESIYIEHLDRLKMKIKKYSDEDIFEFDSLDELRAFDSSYINNTGSKILHKISKNLGCREGEITEIKSIKAKDNAAAAGFSFNCRGKVYLYSYKEEKFFRPQP